MDKYDNVSLDNMSRTKRNQTIYNSNDMSNLSRIKTNTNVSIISDAPKEIDLEKIKNYVYSLNEEEDEKRRRISLELPKEEEVVVERKEIKNYDINSILEEAKDKRESDYEEERYRKLNNTQIDILKNIKIKDEELDIKTDPDLTGPIDELNTEEKTIVDLIQDIQSHGKKKDLFEDLMGGDEETTVLSPIEEEEKNGLKDVLTDITNDLESIKIPENEFTHEINLEKEAIKNNFSLEDLDKSLEEFTQDMSGTVDTDSIISKIDDDSSDDTNDTDGLTTDDFSSKITSSKTSDLNADITSDITDEAPKIKEIDKSFYSSSMTFNKSDFEGLDDIEKGAKKSSALTKLAIVFIVILLLVTIFLILNFVFNWNII